MTTSSATDELSGERILIFGGSGSLGRVAVAKWIALNNEVVNVSRDEEKQWSLRQHVLAGTLAHSGQALTQIVGDVAKLDDVVAAILTSRPSIICIFACLKHIEICERHPQKAIENNVHGILNVRTALQRYGHQVSVKTVLFVSTDKACLPITTYGCTKAIAENIVQGEHTTSTKWVAVRYGNVLNSSGSVIPYLHANKFSADAYTLTHVDMTRFIMTLEESVKLIEYAVLHAAHNEIIVPKLRSMRIQDLFSIFASRYNKQVSVTGLRCKEKLHEDLISASEAKMTRLCGPYYHIGTVDRTEGVEAFDSSMMLLSIEDLQQFLCKQDLC